MACSLYFQHRPCLAKGLHLHSYHYWGQRGKPDGMKLQGLSPLTVMTQWSANGHQHTTCRHTWALGWGPAHVVCCSLVNGNSGKIVSCKRRELFTSVIKLNKVLKSNWGGGTCNRKKFPPSPLSTLAMFSQALLDLRIFPEATILSLLATSLQGRLYLPKLRKFRETTCCMTDPTTNHWTTSAQRATSRGGLFCKWGQ